MRLLRNKFFAFSFCSTSIAASLFAAPPVEFDRDVHPILAAKCVACHSQQKRSGGLSLATLQDILNGGRSGAAVRPGHGASSLLVQRVTGDNPGVRMPLGAAPLSGSEVALIRSWIDDGARATLASAPSKPKWEAPLSLERPEVPEKVWTNWDSPVDRFVSAYLSKRNLPEPTIVDEAVFARRVSVDIWGLLPPPGQHRNRAALSRALLARGASCGQHTVRGKLDFVLERSVAQRRGRELLLGNGVAQKHHSLALRSARIQYSV